MSSKVINMNLIYNYQPKAGPFRQKHYETLYEWAFNAK